MKRDLFIVLVLSILIAASSVSAGEGEDLFREKCVRCHTLERALTKSKDLEGWKRTIARMSRYSFGEISESDTQQIAVYLAGISSKKEPTMVSGEEKETPLTKEEQKIFGFKKVRVNQFIDPEICEGCHSAIFQMWNGSMHSKAFVDPLWRAATKLFVREAKTPGEVLEMKSCVKCHTPLGFRSYIITSPEDDFDAVPELPSQGIFCNWCHNISEVKHIGDAGYEVDPGGGEEDPSTMLGPFKDSSSDFHPVKYSELHTRSEFCGLCHNVSHAANSLQIEKTYDEWKNSPYNTGNPETSVQCQDCHMRQRPGIPATGKTERPDNPGKASEYGPERKHIWTHYFVGANAIVTKLLGSELHSQMAVERLQNAADLEILGESSYRKNELSYIRVKVINSGAGHYLPTGLTEVRQMWLEVKISDAQGKVLLHSGFFEKNGEIERNAVLYHTVFGNEKGEHTLNVAKADRVLYDHRVPPKGYVIERYAFTIPDDAVPPLTAEVTLNYRSISPVLANLLLEGNAPEIPVIKMTRTVKEIRF